MLIKRGNLITTSVNLARSYDIPSNAESCTVSARQRLFGQLEINVTEFSSLQLLPFSSKPLQLSISSEASKHIQHQKQELRKRVAGHPIVSKNRCTAAEATKVQAALARASSLALNAARQLEGPINRQRYDLSNGDLSNIS